jgi:hypothetical protein
MFILFISERIYIKKFKWYPSNTDVHVLHARAIDAKKHLVMFVIKLDVVLFMFLSILPMF